MCVHVWRQIKKQKVKMLRRTVNWTGPPNTIALRVMGNRYHINHITLYSTPISFGVLTRLVWWQKRCLVHHNQCQSSTKVLFWNREGTGWLSFTSQIAIITSQPKAVTQKCQQLDSIRTNSILRRCFNHRCIHSMTPAHSHSHSIRRPVALLSLRARRCYSQLTTENSLSPETRENATVH